MKTFSKVPAEKKYNEIVCNLCGSEKLRPLWSYDGWALVKCRNCGLVFQNPQPSEAELALRYDGEYFNYEIENEDSFFYLMELGLKDAGFDELEKTIFEKPETAAGRKPVFLDVGCATGRLIDSVRGRGWSVRGVELCRDAAEYGNKERGLDISIGTITDASIPDSSIDVMHSSHLVEHLTAPDEYFREAARIIRPGGYLITVTPDISGFQARLFASKWRSAIADHMFLFSRRTLSAMLEKNGFEVLKTASWGGLASGTAPLPVKKAADRLVKVLGKGDVVCILSKISD